MKFNMGCGFNKADGFINVDKFAECSPDLLMDLEKFPWDIEDNSAEYVLFNHCLEHLGQETEVFFGIMKELYRVSAAGATIEINVPHPRHDNFIGDPTHVRIISPQVLSLFSKKNCIYWSQNNFANSPLALYLNVDFEIKENLQILENKYYEQLQKGILTNEEINVLTSERNNIVNEYRIKLTAIK